MSVEQQFTTICALVRAKYPKFIGQEQMDRIVAALGVQIMSQVQYRTMHRNKALKKLDFHRPLLLTLRADQFGVDSVYGHVGFIVPTNKTKKLYYQQFIGAITGRISMNCMPSSNIKKKKFVEKLNRCQQERVPYNKSRADLNRMFAQIRLASKSKIDKTPNLVQEKSWALYYVMAKQFKVVWERPSEITSKLSSFIASITSKKSWPQLWKPSGQIAIQTYECQYGFVEQVVFSVVSLLCMLLTFSRWSMYYIFGYVCVLRLSLAAVASGWSFVNVFYLLQIVAFSCLGGVRSARHFILLGGAAYMHLTALNVGLSVKVFSCFVVAMACYSRSKRMVLKVVCVVLLVLFCSSVHSFGFGSLRDDRLVVFQEGIVSNQISQFVRQRDEQEPKVQEYPSQVQGSGQNFWSGEWDLTFLGSSQERRFLQSEDRSEQEIAGELLDLMTSWRPLVLFKPFVYVANEFIDYHNRWMSFTGDQFGDHWLDYIREKPSTVVLDEKYSYFLVDRSAGQWCGVLWSLWPNNASSDFLNWVLGRNIIQQQPIYDLAVQFFGWMLSQSTFDFKSFKGVVLGAFFTSDWDHRLQQPSCPYFSDDTWCQIKSWCVGVWNGVASHRFYPGFIFVRFTVLYVFVVFLLLTFKRNRVYVRGFSQKKINQASLKYLKPEQIPHLYASGIQKPKTQEMKFGGIKVIRTRSGKRVVHSPVGCIDQVFNKLLMSYGWGFTMQQLNKASHYSGGHANLRAAVDALQADAIQRVAVQILSSSVIGNYQIVDVGAKFSKISRVITQRLTLSFLDVYPLRKDDDLKFLGAVNVAQVKRAHKAAVNLFNIDGNRYHDEAGFLAALDVAIGQRVMVQQAGLPVMKPLSDFCDALQPQVISAYARVVGRVKYLPVRPRVSDYDVNYYLKELAPYTQRLVQECPVECVMPYQGKIQDFVGLDNGVTSNQRFYLVFDSHYYLADWIPAFPGRVLLVGGDFCSTIGTYSLPLGQGEYKIYRNNANGQALMKMVCRSSGTFYVHPLVHVQKCELRMDYGWYAHVMHDCHSSKLKIVGLSLPEFSMAVEAQLEQQSVQANWIYDLVSYCQKSAKTTTKRSEYDKLFWKPRLTTTPETLQFPAGQVQQAKMFVSLNNDYLVSPVVKIQSVACGMLARVLTFLRILGKVSIDFAVERSSEEKFQAMGYKYQVRQMAEQQRAERYLYGFAHAADIHLRGEGQITQQLLQNAFNEDFPVTKKVKSPLTGVSKCAVEKPVFFTKPCPKIPYVSRHLIRDCPLAIAASDLTVDRVNQYVLSKPDDGWESNGKVQERSVMAKVVPTGYSFLGDLHQFQWSSKSFINAIYAMYHRHLACRLQPQVQAIAEFGSMTDRYISWIATSINSTLKQDPSWDPIKCLKEKKQFNRAKRKLYYDNLLKTLMSGKVGKGAFMTMVKSGQVYYTSQLNAEGLWLHGQSSRPRNIMRPGDSLCGVLTLLQNVLWKPLKKAEKGFVQGLTKKELITLFSDNICDSWRVICLDGSSFDSTQNKYVMQCVDDKFWTAIKPGLSSVLEELKVNSPDVFKSQPQQVLDGLMKQILQPHNICFTFLPGIRSAVWPQDIWKVWLETWGLQVAKGKDRDFVQSNYIFNQIAGTTFSGHPTKTTLGNTIRSLSYVYHYLQKIGLYEPWKREDVKVFAAGDDVIIFCAPHLQTRISDAVLAFTSRGDSGIHCLGQRVKEVFSGGLKDIDFCSKWAFGHVASGLDLVRDVSKVLSTRQFYCKSNAMLVTHPALHAKAILQGFKSDKVSTLVQDILQVRLANYVLPVKYSKMDLSVLSDRYRIGFSDSGEGYKNEAQVNARCGITSANLYRLMLSYQFSNNSFYDARGNSKISYGYVDDTVLTGRSIHSQAVVEIVVKPWYAGFYLSLLPRRQVLSVGIYGDFVEVRVRFRAVNREEKSTQRFVREYSRVNPTNFNSRGSVQPSSKKTTLYLALEIDPGQGNGHRAVILEIISLLVPSVAD